MPEREFDALLLDVGNVVVQIDFNRVLAHWSDVSGAPPTALRERFRHDEPYERHERGEISAAQYFASLRHTLGIDIADEQFTIGWNDLFVDEMPGIRALLARFESRWPMYAFSNTNAMHYEAWWSRFDHLFSGFEAVFVSSDIGMRKPEPAAFEHVSRAMGMPPERILFFDDSAENIAGAIDAGLQAVLVRSVVDIEDAIAARTR